MRPTCLLAPQCKSGYEKDGDKCVAKCGLNEVRYQGRCVVRGDSAIVAYNSVGLVHEISSLLSILLLAPSLPIVAIQVPLCAMHYELSVCQCVPHCHCVSCHCVPQCKPGYHKIGGRCVAKCRENQFRYKGKCVVRGAAVFVAWALTVRVHSVLHDSGSARAMTLPCQADIENWHSCISSLAKFICGRGC
jgi:hypothetical protein